MAEHDDHDKHDDHAAGSGRGEESVKRADDPPTLPPFASDGPRPNTIHGFPAVEVFGDGLGDGGLGDLFDVPKLGARTESPPVPKAAPPLVRPLASRTGFKAPTGPVPIIPQSPAIKAPAAQAPVAQASLAQASVAPTPVAPTPASDARNEPTGREPASGSQQHDFTDDSDGDGDGDGDRDRGPAKPTSLPSATSLIEKIRAAKRKEAEQADAAEPSAETKPEPKPEAKPTPELTSVARPVAAKIQSRAAPPQPPASRPPPPKPPSSTAAAEPRPAPPKPPSSSVAAEPKPLESAVETVKLQVPAAEAAKPEQAPDDKVWLEPVPLASLDRRHSAPIPTPPADASPAADAPRADAPPTADTPTPEPVEPVKSSAADALPIPPLSTEPDEHDGERTIAFNKPSGRVGNPLPAPPAFKPVLAPPPSTSAGHAEHQPKVGAPYVPPALVLERSDDAPASEPRASEEVPSPDHDTEVGRPRAALPIPGNWRPPHEAMNPITAARLASGVVEPLVDPVAEAEAVPERITAQDTASLVNGLADELIAEHEPAANSAALANSVELDSDNESTFPAERRRKYALYFLGVAAVLSLIVALLPSKETANESARETEPTPEIAKAPEPEPDPNDPELLAEAQPPEPEPVPQDSLPASDTKTGADAEAVAEPEPQPVASAKPKPKSQQPKSESASKSQPTSQPKLEPKPQPKPPAPTPGGPDDKRSADELYDAAKAAYNSGRAAEAYKLAYASWRKKDKSKTAELMTLAACKLKDKTKATSSLAKVAGLRRNAIKKDCQGLGLSL